MPVLMRPLYQDAFAPVLFSSPALEVTQEQKDYIREVLSISSSDEQFADKAYRAIVRILTGGNAVLPLITYLNPTSAALGSPSFTLQVIGTGFTPESKIIWNGAEEPTTFVSAQELTTGVDMSTAEVAMDIPVMVQSAEGALSEPQTFTLTPAAGAMSASSPTKSTPITKPAPIEQGKVVHTMKQEQHSEKK